MNIQRYSPYANWAGMEANESGGWIAYTDHIAALEAVKATVVTQDMVDDLVNAELDDALAYTGGGAPSLEKEAELKRELTRAREAIRVALVPSPALEANQQGNVS